MNKKLLFAAVSLLVAVALGAFPVSAAGKKNVVPPVVLTDVGNQLFAQFSETLKGLQAEISAAIPAIDEQKKAAFLRAREVTMVNLL